MRSTWCGLERGGPRVRRSALTALLVAVANVAAAQTPTPRIANGVLATGWPEVAAFLTADTTCTATLVGCHTAVTAAHCVCAASGTGAACPGGDFVLDPATAVLVAPQVGALSIGAIHVPPTYAFATRSDLAVLDLSAPIRGVRPRPINETGRTVSGTSATIVGYGRTQQSLSDDAGLLRVGAVLTAPCVTVPGAFNVCWNFLHPLDPPGTDSNTCPGDSGGPLLADVGSGLALVGVHSGGFGDTCEGDGSSFDTDVFVERSWLRQQAGVDLDADTCGDGPAVGDPGVTTLASTGTLAASATPSFTVPAGTKLLRVGLAGDFAGDYDLYVRAGALPTQSVFTCSSAFQGSFEYCEVADPAPGTWYALLDLFGGPSTYQLTTTFLPEDPPPPALAIGQVVVSNFTSFELVQADLASGDRAITSSRLRGSGPALDGPEGVAFDRDGSLLVANPFQGNVLRTDAATGDRSVVSGCADAGCTSSVGSGAPFLEPRFVALARDGAVLVADRTTAGVYAIVRVDPASGARSVLSGCTDATCTTVVGAGPAIGRLFGIAVEADDSILVADGLAVFRIDPATGNRTLLSGCPDAACAAPVGAGPAFGEPVDLAVERGGSILVTYQIEGSPFGALRRIDPTSGARTLVSGCQDVGCTTVRGAGPRFVDAFGVALDRDGSVLVTDAELDALLRVDPASGDRTLLSGCADAPCSSALGAGPGFAEPLDIAVVPEPAGAGSDLLALLALTRLRAVRRRRVSPRA